MPKASLEVGGRGPTRALGAKERNSHMAQYAPSEHMLGPGTPKA